ncbi:DNA helicase/exodeoxyribonuclease V, beta subunit [Marinobacter sp. es.048]|uniref:exodeoxyribonuclease V subunit beta n=1 Tax=Marinobacter sp. es.048 TaxID=1761795 RepID=UPI000B58E261|nr:exodeoxyribonuclease V subunit beta [Marinobacter sp. es.048]SNC61686.1 DNA helicase/exodeoxyribonuclease V, beta subunit [Marinobacter sp. es.048]
MTEQMNNRNPNLDPLDLALNGSALIEASAGTGKTFTIAILYVRLVLGHGQSPDSPLQNLLPPNLLVVTFTEAATKELRDRIRTRLTQAAEVFSDAADEPDPPAETALIYQLRDESYPDPDSWPECRKKLLLAAEWMDEAAVSTIHSFCNRMLSEHAFDSGSLFKLTLETDQSELLDEVARDYWRTFVYPLPPALMDEALSHWKTPGDLRQGVRNLIDDPQSLGTPPDSVHQAIDQVVRRRLEQSQALKGYPWGQWRGEVIDLLNELNKSKRLHGASKNAMVKVWDFLVAWAESDDLLPEKIDTAAGFKNQTPEGLDNILKGDESAPHHPAFDAIKALLDFSQNQPSAKSDILRHASHWMAERLESEKQKRSEMGFDDLLTRLDDALHGPRGDQLAATIRRQFPVALIDEFQDTDPVQYRIFDRIYDVAGGDSGTCLLMIGDPKQAIYGFRGADIYTYLQARQGVKERTYTLGKNFRSAKTMVAAVNQVFEHSDQHSRDGAFLFGKGDTSPLPFQGVDANGTKRSWSINGEVQPSLVFWTHESGEEDRDGNPKGIAKGSATADVAETCASEIARLLTLGQAEQAGFALPDHPEDLEPVAPKDIAILVNNRNEASAVRDALGRRRIKSVYLSDRDSVLTSRESQEMLGWLRAFAEPRQLAYIRAALATPTLGQSWHAMNQLLTDELVLEREIERFIGYQQQWQKQGVLPMLRTFLMDFEVPGRLLQRPDGERRLTDILHIAELLQQDSLQLDGEHALVHHYTQILRAADEEDEHRTLRLESDAGLVKVITVHKSKGLEYPLVFLPFGTAFRAQSEKQAFVRYHNDQGRLVTVFDPSPDDVASADRERLGEDIRKLYVALTRARFATWVGAAALDNWRKSGLGYLIAGDAQGRISDCLDCLAQRRAEIRITPLPDPYDTHYHEPAPEALGPAMISYREAKEDWWIASYSSIEYTGMTGTGIAFTGEVEDAQTQNLLEESTLEEEEDSAQMANQLNQHNFPKGAGPGTFLHELLEWCTQQGFRKVVDNPPLLHEQLTRRCGTRGWSDWVEPLERWLLALISKPLSLDRAGTDRVSVANLATLRPELEFWFESRNVSVRKLDQLVTTHTLNGADRPRVEETRFNGMLKGFIDLVFEHNGRYYVLDYKSNTLGEDDSAYTDQAMGNAILDKRYDLQYVLYLLALHRLLKARLPDYDYDRHIGGAVYLFLRGIDSSTGGAFTDKPPRALIEQLDALFDGESVAEVAA